jgi:hypothetical protein
LNKRELSELKTTLATAEQMVGTMMPAAKPWLTKARVAIDHLENTHKEIEVIRDLAKSKGQDEIAKKLGALLPK